MLGLAGAPVASITVTSEMARMFCWTFCGDDAVGKANKIKSRATVRIVFNLVSISLSKLNETVNLRSSYKKSHTAAANNELEPGAVATG